MPRILYDVSEGTPPPREVSGETRAVRAAPYVQLDDEAGNPGGVTRADLDEPDIQTLGDFRIGDEVFVEGDPDETLDPDDPEQGRIWWRATVTGALAPGGTA